MKAVTASKLSVKVRYMFSGHDSFQIGFKIYNYFHFSLLCPGLITNGNHLHKRSQKPQHFIHHSFMNFYSFFMD